MSFKGLLLSTACVVLVGGQASAADLAVAEPVSYVKVCDAFGSGYYYAPGTQTCIKVGGYVRFDVLFDNNNGSSSAPETDDHHFESTFNLSVTAKSMTEFGPLTGYVDWGPASGNSLGANEGWREGNAYIEWGPLLVGYTSSIFTYIGEAYQSGTFPAASRTDQIRFSWASGPIGLQLAAEDYRDRAFDVPTGSIPDLVAALTFKSGIFDAKIAAGYGDRVVDDTAGVIVGLGIDLSTIAKGDKLQVLFGYSSGSDEWVQYHSTGGNYAKTGNVGNAGDYTLIGGLLTHYLTPKLSLTGRGVYITGDNGHFARGTLTGEYSLATNLKVGAEAVWQDRSSTYGASTSTRNLDGWSGRIRMQRDFP